MEENPIKGFSVLSVGYGALKVHNMLVGIFSVLYEVTVQLKLRNECTKLNTAMLIEIRNIMDNSTTSPYFNFVAFILI